jgi:LacI family transcriptional regulator
LSDLTLEDIARQAGVSRSTVSRVVNNLSNVSEDVRQRVLDVIQETNYHPHAAARALASHRSWTIGLILPRSVSFFFTDPYYMHLTRGIAQACNQNGYTLALFLADVKDDEEKIVARVARKGFLDGVIIQSGSFGDDAILERIIESGMPLVVCGRPFRPEKVSYVDIDNVNSVYNAMTYLIRLGNKRIGTITGPINSTVGIDRLEGYRRALLERGLPVDETLIAEGDFTENGGYFAMKNIIPHKPDAIFVASDVMARGAMRAIRETDLNIPGDIAIIGFDDLPNTTYTDYQLTTVRQPIGPFGVRAVETLIDLIENGIDPPRRIIMDTELVVRGSSGVSRR